MSLEAIAAAENTTPAAIHVLIGRAVKKLKKGGLLLTAKQLADELDAHRATAHTVRPRSRRRGGAE